MNSTEKNFNVLYSENYKRVRKFFASKLSTNECIGELTNDTFMKVFNHFEKFDGKDASINTWIMQIAKNKLIDHYRKENKERQVKYNSYDNYIDSDGKEFFQPTNGQSVESQFIKKERLERMQKALLALNPKNRRIANFYYNHGLKYNEIAQKMDIPMGTVKGNINRIKTQLKENYKLQAA